MQIKSKDSSTTETDKRKPAEVKKVLIITYCFPPMAAVGVYRPLKFIKYLRDYGWEPIVLTVKSPRTSKFDYSLIDYVPPDLKVYRTGVFEPLQTWEDYLDNRKRKKHRNSGGCDDSVIEEKLISDDKMVRLNRWTDLKGLIKKMRAAAASTLSTPDKSVGWLVYALPKAVHIIRKENIDCIFTTTPPHSAQLIGYFAKKITGKPFISDYRDPWTQNVYFDEKHSLSIFKAIEEKMEKAVHGASSFVIANTYFQKENFEKKYLKSIGDKFHAIYNGYDPDDFHPEKAHKYDKFTIVYVGSFYGKQDPNLFLQALKTFLEKNPHARADIQVLFIGVSTGNIRQIIDSYGLAGVVKQMGFLPQSEAFNYLLGAHLLLMVLVFDPLARTVIPAKLYEYLPTGRPILALIPDGEAAQIIRENNAGTVITRPDVDAVEKAVSSYYMEYQSGKYDDLTPQLALIEKYTRRYQTRQLAELLDRAVTKEE
jgi:glycosyltransferase involved in cell wall biosynthesis